MTTDSLILNITKHVNDAVLRFTDELVKENEILKLRLNDALKKLADNGETQTGTDHTSEDTKPVISTPVCTTADDTKTCKHMWVKGPKKGTFCGCVVKNPTRDFCSKHAKSGVKPNQEPKKVPVQSPGNAKILRRNKSIDKLWHEETGMVFASVEDRTVTHRYVDGELEPLKQEDISKCKEMGFAFRCVEDVRKTSIEEVEDLLNGLQVSSETDSDDDLMEEED